MPKGIYERTRVAPEERFWRRVDFAGPVPPHRPELGECWEWKGGKNRGGYGRHDKTTAHRFAYVQEYGSITRDVHVMHLCDNRVCVRFDHLEAGTTVANNRDRDAKDRQAKGERVNTAKMTAARVRALRRLAQQGALPKDLAARFNISRDMVYWIIRRKAWRHVD